MTTRETVDEKGRRYLTEGRLARCRGRGAEYALGLGVDGWYCGCPARGRCCHRVALELVVVGRRF